MSGVRWIERSPAPGAYRAAPGEVERRLVIRWWTAPAIFGMALGLPALALFGYRLIMASRFGAEQGLMLGVAVMIAYGLATLVLNRTTLFVQDGQLRFRRGPLPWLAEPPLPLDRIADIVVREETKVSHSGSKDLATQFGCNHYVYVIMRDGQERLVGRSLPPDDAAVVADKLRVLRAEPRGFVAPFVNAA